MLEIVQTENSSFRFHFKSSSGGIILKSPPFKDKAMVQRVVSNIERSKKSQLTFERRTNHEGKFLFEMRDKRGNLLGKSLCYQSEAGMENGIKNLRESILTAK